MQETKAVTVLIHAANVVYGKTGIKLKLYFDLNYPGKISKLHKINKYRVEFYLKFEKLLTK